MAVRKITANKNGNSNYGFVLKGERPCFIEEIRPNSRAYSAGLRNGDAVLGVNGIDLRRANHFRVVQLIQYSEPKLELLVERTNEHGKSARIIIKMHNSNTNKLAKSFNGQVDYLLTVKERQIFQSILMRYSENRNAETLLRNLLKLLDTNSKKQLWRFILPKLSESHKKYILQRISIPKVDKYKPSVNVKLKNDRHATKNNGNYNDGDRNSIYTIPTLQNSSTDSNKSAWSTFKERIDFLLTEKEKLILKNQLQKYANERTPDELLKSLSVIFDTPSKRKLWYFILPLLTESDRNYCNAKLINLHEPNDIIRESKLLNGSIGFRPSRNSSIASNSYHAPGGVSPREGDVTFQSNYYYYGGANTLIRTAAEPNSSPNDFLTNPSKPLNRSTPLRKSGESSTTTYSFNTNDDAYGAVSVLTVNPETVSLPSSTLLQTNEISTQTDQPSKNYRTLVRLYGEEEDEVDILEIDDDPNNSNSSSISSGNILDKIVSLENERRNKKLHSLLYPNKSVTKSTAVQTEGNYNVNDRVDETITNNTGNNYNMNSDMWMFQRTLSALKTLDDAVADEPSDELDDDENISTNSINNNNNNNNNNESSTQLQTPPKAPPAPPLPAGLQIGKNNNFNNNYNYNNHHFMDNGNVKRINWEKIDNVDEKSLWAKLSKNVDLENVVKYLELEQQFSWKKNHVKVKKNLYKVSILNAKKAYNISILLSQLKKTAMQLKECILDMDDRTLSADLLGQLLTFLPDSDEITKFKQYTGKVEDLSLPDQFMYQITTIPNYEERLKSLSFKASFPERVDELERNLRCIRRASSELLNSRKLAKALELVLAIGNYMNKGSSRIGDANGFKIGFLSQLDMTKTSDKKGTFLNVLAEALYTKYPNMVNIKADLPTIQTACKVPWSKVSQDVIKQEVEEIKTTLKFNEKTSPSLKQANDKYHKVMTEFLKHAKQRLEKLSLDYKQTMDEYLSMLRYFGEDNGNRSELIFEIIYNFVNKFEKAHKENLDRKSHENALDSINVRNGPIN